jgi:hypothetical protein
METQKRIRNTRIRGSSLVLLVGLVALGCVASAAFAAPDAQPPCSANSESRQLDFWLGTWNITYRGAPAGTVSTVKLVLDQCELVESWDDGQGHKGENRFAYNYENKSWRGMFADNRGHVHVFTDGNVSGGSAEFSGPNRDPDGHTTLHRIRVTHTNPNKVEQIWEKSSDNGTTWTTVFRGEYSRKTP